MRNNKGNRSAMRDRLLGIGLDFSEADPRSGARFHIYEPVGEHGAINSIDFCADLDAVDTFLRGYGYHRRRAEANS